MVSNPREFLSIIARDHAAVTEVKFPKDQMQKRSQETRRSSASSIETEDGTDVCVTQESQHGEMGIDARRISIVHVYMSQLVAHTRIRPF